MAQTFPAIGQALTRLQPSSLQQPLVICPRRPVRAFKTAHSRPVQQEQASPLALAVYCLLTRPAVHFQIVHKLQTCPKPLLDRPICITRRHRLLLLPRLERPAPLNRNSAFQTLLFLKVGRGIWPDTKS